MLLVQGGPGAFRWSFLLMAAATIVDSTDGFLARKVRIKEVVPSFDGRRLDDLVDFLNYTFLPLLLIWRAGILPPGQEPWLFLPLLASAYGFCQVQAKTDDGYFLGLPVALERRGPLSLHAAAGALAVAGRRRLAGDPHVRADPPPLPVATGQDQSPGDPAWRSLDDPLRLADLEASAGSRSRLERVDHAMGVDFAVLSRCFIWAFRGRSALPTGRSA